MNQYYLVPLRALGLWKLVSEGVQVSLMKLWSNESFDHSEGMLK